MIQEIDDFKTFENRNILFWLNELKTTELTRISSFYLVFFRCDFKNLYSW